MARVVVDISDELAVEVREAGIPIQELFRRALQDELSRLEALALADDDVAPVARRVHHDRRDDHQLYAQGFAFGVRWARESASLGEMWQIAMWRDQRWRTFSVHTGSHSLPAAYCLARQLAPPPAGEDFWFEREAFTTGMVEGVADIYHKVVAVV